MKIALKEAQLVQIAAVTWDDIPWCIYLQACALKLGAQSPILVAPPAAKIAKAR